VSLDVLIFTAVALVAAAITLYSVRSRARRERESRAALEEANAGGRRDPPTLHPVIDPDICIGSLSCLQVCPEGDILGVLDNKAELINPSACIGHGKCALECPVNAISLVFGTAQRGQDLPEVDEYFETSRAGVHIVGELGGMGLIKNAFTQGLQVADHLGVRVQKAKKKSAQLVDVAIVGAGPAGIAAAMGLKKAGLSFRVLEQEAFGGAIAQYPRQKVVMSEKVDLPFVGKFGKTLISKEELIAGLENAVKKADFPIEQGVKVTGLTGDDGAFTLETTKGPVSARKVVLAVGRRGSPRKMGVPGEELEKVSYRLIDPQQYENCKVLVVGGGDSALEAAIMLAEESSAEVTLSYRNAELGRCRERNKAKLKELVARKAIRTLMPSNVVRVTPKEVVLEAGGKQKAFPNDFIIVCIGGELPAEFLGKVGVGMQRLFGSAPGAYNQDEVSKVRARKGSARDEAERLRRRRLAAVLTGIGLATLALLVWVGGDYYGLTKTERLHHPAHAFLKPSGPWGHGVGIVATLVMMSNFLYALRKRWGRLKGTGSIRGWLTFHQFVGFVSPMVIAFHAAFQSNNVLATATAASLGVVVMTGVVGRFIFGMVPTNDGTVLKLEEVLSRWERMKARIRILVAGATDTAQVKLFLDEVTQRPDAGGSTLGMLLGRPVKVARMRRGLARLRPMFRTAEAFDDFKDSYLHLEKLQLQVGFFQGLKRLLASWRIFHVVLAGGLVVMIAAHIGVSLFLGYTWIFR
jgi:dihydropyrimidine dehydrogenase (NAD+) subunit PreT